ncbi:MAG TPA: glycosyltransferase family 39 protein [Aestuariivirgaceae bacterium]|nr:glycosyltransferase family 39 protein [Aestuariivirgaceae bacterium]
MITLLVASFAVIVLGVFRQSIGGDEYIFLAGIHRAANGERLGLLQTAYVHLFAWLPLVEHNEILQMSFGRLINAAAWGGSLALLYRLGRRLLDPLGALASVVLFAVFSYSVATAVHFRIDGLLLPVLLSTALLLLNPTIGRVAAAGALSGLAVAMSIKAVLWAPAFIGVLAFGLWNSEERLRPILAGAVAGTVTCAGIMMIHARLISLDLADIPATAGQGSSVAGRYMLFNGFIPQWDFLKLAVLTNPGTWILLAIGMFFALAGLRQAQSRRKSLLLLLLALPVLSFTFYTNAFPYSYIVLIPTACLLAGHAFSTFAASGERPKQIVALGCLGMAAMPMVSLAWEYRDDGQERQKRIVTEVHRLFPEPVPYIDISGMVASFPRPALNITWYGLDLYRRAGVPALANYIHNDKPPLLIVNTKVLKVWDEAMLEGLDSRLLPQDEETIRATYAHYWDQIWLAGRQWRDLAANESRAFEIIVPGDHTVMASGPVIVDGQTYQPWTTIRLDEGPHELRTTSAEPDLRILWGTRLVPLEDLPPSMDDAEE